MSPDGYGIIGAGAAGLRAAHGLRRRGIPYEQFERHRDVGGMWDIANPHSAVYESTHMISTRRSTEFRDFPMRGISADYPHHSVVGRYFRDFAREFGLYPSIEFERTVEHVAPVNGHWELTLDGGERRRYRGVIVANGHQSEPSWPALPGSFDGEALHSFRYKSPRLLDGKRVLVVGAGNSGCDIVVDAAPRAAAVFLSLRRGYHVVPKYSLLGLPTGDLGGHALPEWLERRLAVLVLRLLVGDLRRFGLPRPDHALLWTHAIVNSRLLYHLGHGDVQIKPDVERLSGDRVRFADGSEERIDVIVYATGYRVALPFLDPSLCTWRHGVPELHLGVFHPRLPGLFAVGLVESVDGGNWRLFARQADLVGAYLAASQRRSESAARLDRARAQPVTDVCGCARPHYVRNRTYLRLLDRAVEDLER
jgi:cation diffusion facilitator CzcD-associated flavoprotein CzcO